MLFEEGEHDDKLKKNQIKVKQGTALGVDLLKAQKEQKYVSWSPILEKPHNTNKTRRYHVGHKRAFLVSAS